MHSQPFSLPQIRLALATALLAVVATATAATAATNEVIDFPLGLDPAAGWKTVTARVNPGAFDPLRDSPSVLVVTAKPPASSGADGGWLVSWAPVAEGASFPPPDAAAYYSSVEQYLWRWIIAFGPDAVVTDNASLAAALAGSVTVVDSVAELPQGSRLKPSALRAELRRRASRSTLDIAGAIEQHYGKRFPRVAYQPALAMVARARLARLRGGDLSEELIAITNAAPAPRRLSGPAIAGHLIHAELGLKDEVIAAAEAGIRAPGHNEMSDSVFMVCPLLAAAGRLSGDDRYFSAGLDHLETMQRLGLRPDGLYRHSPLDEAAWGRGNGFPALGLAWAISETPQTSPARPRLADALGRHIAALAPHQDASGMWHQVIDHPGSYREFTATCMITFALLRGMREGVLDRGTYAPPADRAWPAIKLRVSLDGQSFTDACTGTGKQKSLRDYLGRKAILGPDERAAAIALLVATERALWEREAGRAR